MHIDDTDPTRLRVVDGDITLLDYVHAPSEPQVESPRPYALLATRSGRAVTAYRPDDHVWHKGLSLALPVVGEHNFWGGPTYVHGSGYVQLANNGAQVHESFDRAEVDSDGVARITESLNWIAEDGSLVLTERRQLTARLINEKTWTLVWHSTLVNVSQDTLGFGSPTSKGRENAGYAGVFWRGPVDFTGGQISSPSGPSGDAARGEVAPWLAFLSPDRAVGIAMTNGESATDPWFARSEEYAGLNPAPFFFREKSLAPDDALTLSAGLVIGAGDVDRHIPTLTDQLDSEIHTP